LAAVTKANLDTLFTRLQELEAEKKRLSEEIAEAFDLFTVQYGEGNEKTFKKAIKSAYKKHKDILKDRAAFILMEAEVDQLTERILED
jgi:uncharacterized protein (UPF0335 family)